MSSSLSDGDVQEHTEQIRSKETEDKLSMSQTRMHLEEMFVC